jgi:hypothetical protein
MASYGKGTITPNPLRFGDDVIADLLRVHNDVVSLEHAIRMTKVMSD